MNSQNTEQKPALNWLPVTMFATSTLALLTLVPWYGIQYGYNTSAVVAFIAITWITGMSITGGYHRLWSHNAYEAHPVLRVWYALWGAAAMQNTVLDWCSGHRTHHRHCDDIDLDPYSAKRGLWYSHMGWMLRKYPSGEVNFDNVKNLKNDPIVMWQYKYYMPITLSMNFGIPIILGLIFGDILGMLLLAGVARLVLAHHITFFINSIAHKWGSQPYTDDNTARDNTFFAFLTHGEGYHNYHHIFQTDYRNGIRWFHWDPTKWFIKACSWIGLTKNLKRVPDFKIQRAKVKMQFKRANEEIAKASTMDHQLSEHIDQWTLALEKEYADFKTLLNEWTELQAEKYQQTCKSLQEKWHGVAFSIRFKEIEEGLRLQNARLKLLNAQFSFTNA
jgi:stearoyl-CoA desaturase (delta-9 desaturase)